MSKKWSNVDVIFNDGDELTNELKIYDRMMKTIPNHDKKYDNTHKVYEKNEYVILKVYSGSKVGFILYNTNKEWKGGHTHLDSFDMAKTIISNVSHKKKPKTTNVYLMKSHMRVSDDEQYIKYIEELIETKRNKTKDKYYNRMI